MLISKEFKQQKIGFGALRVNPINFGLCCIQAMMKWILKNINIIF